MTAFKYDGYGRRTEIIEIDSNGKKTSDKRYVWSGASLCEEHDMLAGGAVTKRYFSQGVQMMQQQRFGPRLLARYYYTFDRLGTVYQLVDSIGSVRAQYNYDPYGNRVQTLGDLASDIGYTGLFHHQPSGLVMAVARVYSPLFGRWLSRDPIEKVDSLNLYTYVYNNPLNASDPLGTQLSRWYNWVEGYRLIAKLIGVLSGEPKMPEEPWKPRNPIVQKSPDPPPAGPPPSGGPPDGPPESPEPIPSNSLYGSSCGVLPQGRGTAQE